MGRFMEMTESKDTKIFQERYFIRTYLENLNVLKMRHGRQLYKGEVEKTIENLRKYIQLVLNQ